MKLSGILGHQLSSHILSLVTLMIFVPFSHTRLNPNNTNIEGKTFSVSIFTSDINKIAELNLKIVTVQNRKC